MDNHNQLNKLYGICGKRKVSNDYHGLYNPCKICVAKNSARYYQANRDNIFARSKFYQENTKYVSNCHTQQIEELKNEFEEITWATEKFFLQKFINVY